MSAPTRDELRVSILRRHPCYCEDACRCTAGHVERDLDALLKLERERCAAELVAMTPAPGEMTATAVARIVLTTATARIRGLS